MSPPYLPPRKRSEIEEYWLGRGGVVTGSGSSANNQGRIQRNRDQVEGQRIYAGPRGPSSEGYAAPAVSSSAEGIADQIGVALRQFTDWILESIPPLRWLDAEASTLMRKQTWRSRLPLTVLGSIVGIQLFLSQAARDELYHFLPFDLFSVVEPYRPLIGWGFGAVFGWSLITFAATAVVIVIRLITLSH
jgi:hypothetical protein